jgi:hypothetical protein
MATKQPAQITDIRSEPAYIDDPQRFAILDLAGARTVLSVPMVKENELMGAITISIVRRFDGALHLVAAHNIPPALAEARRRLPLVPGQHPIIDRMVTTKTASHVIDAAATSEYIERTSPGVIEVVELGGVRTTLARQR